MKMVDSPIQSPKIFLGLAVFAVIFLAMLAVLPSLWPERFSMLNPLMVDTDPENMLPKDEPIRVFHNKMQKEFALYEIIVLGVVNEKHSDGVFNIDTLTKMHHLVNQAKKMTRPAPGSELGYEGIISSDIISPVTVDVIEQDGPGKISFEWLMKEPPATREEALEIRERALRIPLLRETMFPAASNKAMCIYLPVTSKSVSYWVSNQLQEEIDKLGGDDQYHITGLPVANDTFGVEMFVQMAISAPLAMLVIFILMLIFFKKMILILSPMMVALLSVIITMSLLVITGNTVHIMSSMIPIFIMPIAVLDSVHILSEFFGKFPKSNNRRQTLREVMAELFMPMLYTTLTSVAGFASLALTPNPPVQVFGIFVAIGVTFAWLFTILLVPAYIMLIPEAWLKGLGEKKHEEHRGWMDRMMSGMHRLTFSRSRLLLVLVLFIAIISIVGIGKIQVNDNPIKWFTPSHPIRVADAALNHYFAGTYMAYMSLEAEDAISNRTEELFPKILSEKGLTEAETQALLQLQKNVSTESLNWEQTLEQMDELLVSWEDDAIGTPREAIMSGLLSQVAEFRLADTPFKNPEVLRYLDQLQESLYKVKLIGKVNTLSDIVKTVRRDLQGGKEAEYRVPDSSAEVAQCLMQFQNSHRPQDLWHFVTPDFRKSGIWLQLKSGNNLDMRKVIDAVAAFIAANPPPEGLHQRWFGLNYINVVWQEEMVAGMRDAFAGSFLVVLLMMVVLYRSALWGFLAMLPLSVTIIVIYGMVGWLGKDYDMPIAVLSSLTLGLAVDFAIHFLSRSRELMHEKGNWPEVAALMFKEPAKAISRNIAVIAIGFTPLLAAPLVPYQTVGVFMALIMLLAGFSTLILLPAILHLMQNYLKKNIEDPRSFMQRPIDFSVSMGLGVLVAGDILKDIFNWPTNLIISAALLALVLAYAYSALRSRKFSHLS